MKLALITTVGTTDVQVVTNGRRCKLDASVCGDLLDEIAKRKWAFVDAPSESDGRIKSLPSGDLMICVPKLDSSIKLLGCVPDSVLILETSRNIPNDPRRAGQFMEKRLKELGVSSVVRAQFLEGDERLEDPSRTTECMVRSAVVCKIDTAVKRFTKKLQKGDKVYLALTGGMPVVCELIREMVKLYCFLGPSVHEIEAPEHGGTAVIVYDPVEFYRLRRYALKFAVAAAEMVLVQGGVVKDTNLGKLLKSIVIE